MGITDSVFVGVVLLARETEGASVYGFGRDLGISLTVGIYSVQLQCVFLHHLRFYSSVLCHRYSSTVDGIATRGRRIMIDIVNVSLHLY